MEEVSSEPYEQGGFFLAAEELSSETWRPLLATAMAVAVAIPPLMTVEAHVVVAAGGQCLFLTAEVVSSDTTKGKESSALPPLVAAAMAVAVAIPPLVAVEVVLVFLVVDVVPKLPIASPLVR